MAVALRLDSLIDLLDRVLDKGVVLERPLWAVGSIDLLHGLHIRVVALPDDDDDGGGDGTASQVRVCGRDRLEVVGRGCKTRRSAGVSDRASRPHGLHRAFAAPRRSVRP